MNSDLTECQICGAVTNRKVGMSQRCHVHENYPRKDGMLQVDNNIYLK